jgi:hypothetical protein
MKGGDIMTRGALRQEIFVFVYLGLMMASAGTILAHDDHDGMHHWEIPSKDPDRIILTFHGDPATSRAVTWRTDESIEETSARIAKAAKNSSFTDIITVAAKTEALDIGIHPPNNDITAHYHSVVFTNLTPGTEYVYQVGNDKHVSEWIQFRTAKAEYAPTQFVYFGDAQNGILPHWSRVIRKAYQMAPNASFAIHAGDLIDARHRDMEWAEWFKAGGFIHSQWTAIPVPGNHEYGIVNTNLTRQLDIHWRPQFTLPVEEELPEELHETVYTVDYQDIRILALNSQRASITGQTAYIERQLKDCTAKWKIMTCHHSIFATASRRFFPFGQDNWKPLMDKYGVDLVLNGHDHTYARGHVPVRTADVKDSSDLGTIYVTSVSGPKQYNVPVEQMKPHDAKGYRLDKRLYGTQFFQVITIESNTLTYIAYTALGEEYDRAVIVKDFKTGKKQLKQ